MNSSGIARRYAKALFDLAVEEGRFEEIGQELASVSAAFKADPNLIAALRSPSTTREERLAVASALADAVRARPILANTLKLLADRARLAELSDVERVYRELADDRSGRLRAKVVSAIPLSDEAAARLGMALSKATRRNVVVERSVDANILGGVIAQVGSEVFDGSIRNQISQLKQQLKA